MRDRFHYFECEDCCCLSLQDPPANLSSFYPPDKYYSFGEKAETGQARNPVRHYLKQLRDRTLCFHDGRVATWITRRFPNQDATDCRKWIRNTSIRSYKSKILDIGCGTGWHLLQLQGLGFTNLTGVDPYLSRDIISGPLRIYACPIATLPDRSFNFVMLHHSLEHVPDQIEILTQIRKLLAPGGECIVRIPIVSKGPWRKYGTDWAEIDAPRHFVLHSEMSLKLAVEAAGLAVKCIQYESEPFSYAASELYQRNLSLYDSDRKCQRDLNSVFDGTERQQFESLSNAHRIPGWAGRAAFFLKQATSCQTDAPVFFD